MTRWTLMIVHMAVMGSLSSGLRTVSSHVRLSMVAARYSLPERIVYYGIFKITNMDQSVRSFIWAIVTSTCRTVPLHDCGRYGSGFVADSDDNPQERRRCTSGQHDLRPAIRAATRALRRAVQVLGGGRQGLPNWTQQESALAI